MRTCFCASVMPTRDRFDGLSALTGVATAAASSLAAARLDDGSETRFLARTGAMVGRFCRCV
jgi:hypothetical protein